MPRTSSQFGEWVAALAVLVALTAPGCGDGDTPGDTDAGRTGMDGGGGTDDAGGSTDDAGGSTDDGGSATGDGAVPSGDAGAGGPACGPTTCRAGEVCCNESCGICTPPDGSCIDLLCSSDDGGVPPSDAGMVDGRCSAMRACPSGQWCDYESCGGAGAGGRCRVTPSGCPRIYDPVCGCDDMTYPNECVANAAGVDVAASGECEPALDCSRDEARGVGDCDAIVGVAWNGTMCVQLTGCSCAGADCARYADLDACIRAHEGCPSTGPSTFACGPDTRCMRSSQYCQAFSGGPSGAVRYTCLPTPDRCAAMDVPTCATCFPTAGTGGPVGECMDDGRGAITVTVSGA